MKLIVEFPMYVVCSYHGADELDVTLDDNISYLIGKYCYDNGIAFKILDLCFVDPEPNVHDELLRYQVELGVNSDEFNPNWMLKELEIENFEKGLTIRSENGAILYADEYSADIHFRREMKAPKRNRSEPKRI
ncbi:MAG: hypothetical protein IPP17_29425 [Bacteroidetes bacterium]|nr:hypothetical protein [Bacteroidota bacterium]